MELFTPEFGLVFWMFLVFVILFVILAKYAWPAIMKSVDERADFIDKGECSGSHYRSSAKATRNYAGSRSDEISNHRRGS